MTTTARSGAGRNPHAGEPFEADDAAVAAALDDVAVPALLCSLVHMTGDPSWIRGRTLRQLPSSSDYQCGLSADEVAEVRQQALPVIAAYRDNGCEPQPLSRDVWREMMSFIASKPLDDRIASMFLEDMQFDGADSRAITWGDEIPAETRA